MSDCSFVEMSDMIKIVDKMVKYYQASDFKTALHVSDSLVKNRLHAIELTKIGYARW